MPRKTPKLSLSPEEKEKLERLVNADKTPQRTAMRARIILLCSQGKPAQQIAKQLNVRPNTVIDRRKEFEIRRLKSLEDRPRSGKPRIYTDEFRNQVLQTLEQPPAPGMASWDGVELAKRLNASPDAVWRVLRKEGVQLSRRRSWCVSTDPEFSAKAADIIGLYLNPPQKALVISVDEKPSIQAIERATGYVQTKNGKIVRGYKSTYKRHGTLNLFAALDVATGQITGKVTDRKTRPDFLEFMDDLVSGIAEDREIHVILDNYCIHKKNDDWLDNHKNVHFHFTPTSASWLNQVEIWFGIFTKKALRGASFSSSEQLRIAIENYLQAYRQNPKPFVWKKREVKGSQLRNTIVNLCK
jgi:transposase